MKTDDTLWNFALELYAKPGVETACLGWQDAGGDVCLLLAGAWLQQRNTAFSDTRLDDLERISNSWHEQVVVPTRALRNAWRASAQNDPALHALRERLKRIELDAEQVQLHRLQAAVEDWPPATGEADWIERIGVRLGRDDTLGPLTTLRGALGDQPAVV